MKIQILSDLHIEFRPFDIPDTDADLVILAGDIHVGEKGVIWAIENIKNKPVIYVLGNHEYYGKAYPKLKDKLASISEGTNVKILENNVFYLENTIFLGCTLWTDLKLFGDALYGSYEASQNMTDYKKIKVSPNYSKLKTIDTVIIHEKSKNWLRSVLAKKSSDNLVIVTHHAPSKRSIPIQYQEDILSAAYASNLDNLVAESGAKLWIHGHIHNQLDYQINSTRVICNPRGYPDEPNNLFNPQLVVKI